MTKYLKGHRSLGSVFYVKICSKIKKWLTRVSQSVPYDIMTLREAKNCQKSTRKCQSQNHQKSPRTAIIIIMIMITIMIVIIVIMMIIIVLMVIIIVTMPCSRHFPGKYRKCLETGKTAKSLEHGKCPRNLNF